MTVADPYVVRIPKFVFDTNDQELISWYEYDNRWKHDIFQQLGGGSDFISDSEASFSRILSLSSQIARLDEQISDDFVTIDTSSFTVDTTDFTIDMTVA